MKYLKNLMLLLAAAAFFACNDCEPVVLEPCMDFEPNSEYCGWTVGTNYARESNGPVGVIYDTHKNSTAPIGDDWGSTTAATPVVGIHPANWTPAQIGQVFGIAIDRAENIFLASSDIYFHDPMSGILSANPSRPAPYTAGQIFKCAPPTWMAVPFATLPNQNDPLNGIGNIAYDKWNNQLFATNLEDGKIYRIDANSGVILDTYDPWLPDNGSNGITMQDERVWGIGVNYEAGLVKVYFPRVTAVERSIYSITLNNGAFPLPGTEVKEIQQVPGTQPIISDIAFSSNGAEMLVAERGGPHNSSVISYSKTAGWNFNKKYFVGGFSGDNAAGGVDFAYTEYKENRSNACDAFFWASGNYMDARNSSLSKIYGIQGIAYTGNLSVAAPAPTANQDTDIFIDFDGAGGTFTKGFIGDVEVFDCTECLKCLLDDYLDH